MKPRVSILSSDFNYVPAVGTDIRRTFARIRREQREHAKQQRLADAANAVIRVAAANDAGPAAAHLIAVCPLGGSGQRTDQVI